jgi:predicted nucleic acid-binding protein
VLHDIVIDTNVFVHAENEAEADCEPSRRLISGLLATTTCLCFDEGFDLDEAKNKSLIAGEYLEHLPAGALAFALIEHCAASDRIRLISTSIRQAEVRRAIDRLVVDPTDRKFVRVARKSRERLLVTHDDQHLHSVAAELAEHVGIVLDDAYGSCARL